MLICDTGGLLAYFDASDAHHARVSAEIAQDAGPFIVSPYVLAELDFLLATRRGTEAELAALAELAGGAWELPCISEAELRSIHGLIHRYRDQQIGLVEGSLVMLAHRYHTDRVLTLDHRHFGVLRTHAGGPFVTLPG